MDLDIYSLLEAHTHIEADLIFCTAVLLSYHMRVVLG